MTSQYFAYLLRLWQINSPDSPTWRASLENPHTHEITGFSSIQALCEHLQNHHFIIGDALTSPEEAEPQKEIPDGG